MLAMMQLITYMYHLEYTEAEIRQVFTATKTAEDVFTLYHNLGLERPINTHVDMFLEKRFKFESALHVINMKRAG